jgi:cytochrome b561
MSARSTATRWGWVARLLHWGMAALLLGQLALGLWMAEVEGDLLRQFALTQTHKSWGTLLLALVLLRLGWRAVDRPAPAMPSGTPGWQVRAARASHVVLYALMLVLPLSGWVYVSASPLQDLLGLENRAFGMVVLPDPWVPGDEPLAEAARTVHAGAALLLGLLLVLHVAAALKHALVDRDGVLARMT